MKLKRALVLRVAIMALIAVSWNAAQAQNHNTENNFRPISVGVSFSPDYNFRTLRDNSQNPDDNLVIRSRNEIEVAKFGYTTGLIASFSCSKHVVFETGLQYSNRGYKTKSRNLTFELPNSSLPVRYRSRYSYQYIGIPLKARFSVGEGTLRFTSSIGIMSNFLMAVKQTTVLTYADGRNEERNQSTFRNFNRIDISPLFSIGLDYKLNKKMHLILEPTFRYGIIKTMDAPVREHLWNAGINFGIYHTLDNRR